MNQNMTVSEANINVHGTLYQNLSEYEKETLQLKAMLYTNTLPFNFDNWARKDRGGWSTLAHIAAWEGLLPDDFNQWAIKNQDGYTVAHTAANNGHLPKGFDQWELRDEGGKTVAHEAAFWNKLPADFDQWGLTDDYGQTVRKVADEAAKRKDCRPQPPVSA